MVKGIIHVANQDGRMAEQEMIENFLQHLNDDFLE